jgi:ABC-type dipeptide/oligopeptide/nickel transport system permease component
VTVTGYPRFVLRRLAAAALFVLLVSLSALTLARLAPGDATAGLTVSGADAATVAAARARLGLDRSLPEQLAGWLGGVVRFDLGESSRFGRPVAGLVAERARNTASLAALALLVASAIGLPLGILTGASPRGWLARVVAPVSIALVSCPPLVGALALLLLAAATGWLSIAQGAYAVPTLALALPIAAMLERLQSQATGEALLAPDIVAAAARGVPPRRLVWRHAARQSLHPVLGIYGLIIGGLFSGSLAVEYVTSWPGLGRLLFDALVARDLFLVTGCVLFGAMLIAAGNLVADLLRGIVDPRVREAT